MPEVNRTQALDMMAERIGQFDTLELLEVYNEVFPEARTTMEAAQADPSALVKRLVEYFDGLPYMDEFTEMFGLIFTSYREVWYNEEEEVIHYDPSELFASS